MNDFSTESLLAGQGIYAVAKGDVAGHEFHGNQYEEGSLSDTSSRLAKFVTDNRSNLSPSDADDIAESHEAHAAAHSSAARQLRDHVEGMTSPENLHRDGEASKADVAATLAKAGTYTKAANAHEVAAAAHVLAADTALKAQGEWGGRLGVGERRPSSSQVSSASNKAAAASAKAEALVPMNAGIQLPLGADRYEY
jgi:hypothetical protein